MNTDELDEWLGCFLTDMDLRRLEGVSVRITSERKPRVVDLLKAWHGHVLRFEVEVGLPDSDRTVWGVWDFIAALALRSRLSRGVRKVDQDSLERFKRALDDVDSRFMKFTEMDEFEIALRLDGGGRSDGEWWWDRIPRVGPIRREADRIKSALSD